MFLEWLARFFLYFRNGTYVSTYSDGLGEGAFGWRHFAWIGVTILLAIGGFIYFRKHPRIAKSWIFALAISLFSIRFFHQTMRAIIGAETPWTRAFPFHMCTVMTFLLPPTIVFNWKKIKTPVLIISMMGGIITLFLGEYFSDHFMTFWNLESMAAHSLLIILPIWEMASGRFKLDIKTAWQVPIGMVPLMVWATLANYVFFPNTDSNYMYLVTNALPFGTQQNFFIFYVLVFCLMLGLIYGLPLLWSKLRSRTLLQTEQTHA